MTPMMEQYLQVKSKYEDAILLFRLGDFYEAFFEDARIVSRQLQLVLTSRNSNPMAGIPHHALDNYLKKLVVAGFKVAICEQVEDPAQAKGIVRREVTRVVTPGTVIEDSILEFSENSFLSAVSHNGSFFVCLLDISTGKFLVFERQDWESARDVLFKYGVVQLLVPEGTEWSYRLSAVRQVNPSLFTEQLPSWYFDVQQANAGICRVYGVKDFSFLELPPRALPLVGALLKYLELQHMDAFSHLDVPRVMRDDNALVLDSITVENLNLVNPTRGARGKSLFDVLDATVTAMGKRLLKSWLLAPLVERSAIHARQAHVAELAQSDEETREISAQLAGMYDLERIVSRLVYARATPKDLASLRGTLQLVPGLRERILGMETFQPLLQQMDPLSELESFLSGALFDEPGSPGDGDVIRHGFHDDLDEVRDLLSGSDARLKSLEEEEKKRTGIPSLRIRRNNVYGYFIEVTKAHLHKVPDNYERKQTLVSSERFISPALKPIEQKLNHAREMVEQLEREVFSHVCEHVLQYLPRLKVLSGALAQMDVLSSLALVGVQNRYCLPTFNERGELSIEDGRHPVVEQYEPDFIPNGIALDEAKRFVILTGPNMSGKSTYLRQVALICLMAQMGSMVPASRVSLPLLDRIFTRIGARDDLASGKSTFLVEMSETATILNNATERSLVVLDEVGRGTSTYDGISIAWVVSEYLFNQVGCFTVFATHYNELTEMARLYPGLLNLRVKTLEKEDGVVFLHRVEPGVADKSYGIEVARLAGLPPEVVDRAYEVLETITSEKSLEERVRVLGYSQIQKMQQKAPSKKRLPRNQMNFLQEEEK